MFWDKVAPAYDLFETVYNAKVYRNTGERVAVEIDENDMVLECACGTGAITIPVAKVCRRIYASAESHDAGFQSYSLQRSFQEQCTSL